MSSTMCRVIRIRRPGGAAALELGEEEDPGPPGPGEVRLVQTAVGLSLNDVRAGDSGLPAVPGVQGTGVAEAVGEGVGHVVPGRRYGYADLPGAWRTVRNVAADRLVPFPDGVDDITATAALLRGLVAHYLLRRLHRLGPDGTVLFHAAAGGVGLIACQWAKVLGARVIGTVGSAAKAEAALGHGCEHVIVRDRETIAERVAGLTGGAGVSVAYDSVGRDTFAETLECLAPMGTAVCFGSASGPVGPLSFERLRHRSLSVAFPTLAAWIADRGDLMAASEELLEMVGAGMIRMDLIRIHPFEAAAEAWRDMELRRTVGPVVLTI